MNDEAQQPEVVDCGNTAEMRAAYLLGRNLHLIEGWVNAVDAIAGCEGRPWTWEYPLTLFGDSFAAWPADLHWDVDEAVRTLVLARVVVDAAALVEFRRLLELIARDCDSMAEFAACDQRDEIGEMAWPVRSTTMSAMRFATRMLTDGPPTMASLQQLGDKLGILLNHLAHVGDHETYPPWLSDMIILARDVLPSDEVMKLVRVRDKIPARGALTSLSEIRDINRQLICSLQELDRWILANFSACFSREQYIVLDDRRRTVTYLGVEISFDDFSEGNALGGLKVLRILVQHPGQWLSTRDLLNQSKISSDLSQITAYLSRLRNVLRRYEERWWNAVQNSVEYSKSRQGFIVPDRGRRPDVGEGAWYKLDLPSFRVRFVSADDR